MKTKLFSLLFLMLLIAVSGNLYSQHVLAHSTFPHPVVKTITRESVYPSTISYVETSQKHYFAYVDSTKWMTCCEIDSRINVRDFCIKDDTVFFCGVFDSLGSRGMWGWFRVDDLMAGSLLCRTYSQFVCGSHEVDTLHSIVVYDVQNERHIATVGTAVSGTDTRGCAIEISPSSAVMGGWCFTIGITPVQSQEKINQVCVTDNYVITSGPATSASGFEVYRRHPKSDIFQTGGPQDEYWFFPASHSFFGHRITQDFRITHLKDDLVGSAFRIYTSGNSGVLVFVHDMATLTNGAVATLFACYGPTYSTQPMNVCGLKYDVSNNSLVLLMNGDSYSSPLGGPGSIVAEIPYVAAYNPSVTIHTLQNIILHSLDLYNGGHSLLCSGSDVTNANDMRFFVQPLAMGAICALSNTIYGQTDSFITKWDPSPFTKDKVTFICCNRRIPGKEFFAVPLDCRH